MKSKLSVVTINDLISVVLTMLITDNDVTSTHSSPHKIVYNNRKTSHLQNKVGRPPKIT